MDARDLSGPGPCGAGRRTPDVPLSISHVPARLPGGTISPGGGPHGGRARISTICELAPTDRDRPASARVQAAVQPGGFHLTRARRTLHARTRRPSTTCRRTPWGPTLRR